MVTQIIVLYHSILYSAPECHFINFFTTGADPSHSPRMTLNVLYKDHGVGRQKELLAHAVRLRMLACRNDLNRKRIVSLQLTADSFYLLTDLPTTGIDPSRLFRMTLNIPLIMTPFPPIVILNGGKNTVWEKREME